MTGPADDASAALEHRYRLLLALYPAAYRSANAEEMLGVALACAAPGQRWPGWGETFSLVRSALRMRVGARLGARGPAWRDAAAVLVLLGPAVLVAANLWALGGVIHPGPATVRFITDRTGWMLLPNAPGDSAAVLVALSAGWAAVAGLALLGRRRATAITASLAAVGETTHLVMRLTIDPFYAVQAWWQVILAVVTALTAIEVLTSKQLRRRPLSRQAIMVVWIPLALIGAGPLAAWALSRAAGRPSLDNVQFGLVYGVSLVLAFIVMAMISRLEPVVRRRVFALCTGPVAAAALGVVVYGGGLFSSGVSPAWLGPFGWPEWAALLGTPALAVAAVLAWIARHERRLQPPPPADGAVRVPIGVK